MCSLDTHRERRVPKAGVHHVDLGVGPASRDHGRRGITQGDPDLTTEQQGHELGLLLDVEPVEQGRECADDVLVVSTHRTVHDRGPAPAVPDDGAFADTCRRRLDHCQVRRRGVHHGQRRQQSGRTVHCVGDSKVRAGAVICRSPGQVRHVARRRKDQDAVPAGPLDRGPELGRRWSLVTKAHRRGADRGSDLGNALAVGHDDEPHARGRHVIARRRTGARCGVAGTLVQVLDPDRVRPAMGHTHVERCTDVIGVHVHADESVGCDHDDRPAHTRELVADGVEVALGGRIQEVHHLELLAPDVAGADGGPVLRDLHGRWCRALAAQVCRDGLEHQGGCPGPGVDHTGAGEHLEPRGRVTDGGVRGGHGDGQLFSGPDRRRRSGCVSDGRQEGTLDRVRHGAPAQLVGRSQPLGPVTAPVLEQCPQELGRQHTCVAPGAPQRASDGLAATVAGRGLLCGGAGGPDRGEHVATRVRVGDGEHVEGVEFVGVVLDQPLDRDEQRHHADVVRRRRCGVLLHRAPIAAGRHPSVDTGACVVGLHRPRPTGRRPVRTIRHVTASGATPLDVSDIPAARARPGFVWVDLAAADASDAVILEELGLPALVVEDMLEDRHLPKVETVGQTLSLTVHGLDVASLEGEARTLELDCAMTEDLLVTWHDQDLASVRAVGERLDAGRFGFDRPFLLLHRVLDVMNDVLLPFVDHLERRLDVIEEDILDEPTDQTRLEIYHLQRDVIQLRRIVVPQAEVVRRLGRDRAPGWLEGDDALVRDLQDHLSRMAALCDSYYQLLDSAMDSYRSALDDRLNEMLTTLTIVSAVLLPVSVLAGLWGMNFLFIPGTEDPNGFWWLLAASGVLVVLLLVWFAARGWIGGRAERRAAARRGALGAVLEVPVLGQVLRVPVHGGRAVGRAARRAVRRT